MMTASTVKVLDEWFESEPLKATLATDSVIGAMISPYSPGSGYVLLHHVMAQTNGIKGAWGFPEGGMGAVTQAMARAAEEAGVHLFVNQPVKEILVDAEGVARGVKMCSGDEIAADSVLSNATSKITFLDLVPGGLLPHAFEKEVRGIDYTSPVCKINVALRSLPDFLADSNPGVVMPHHQCTIHLNCEKSSYIDDAYLEAKRGLVPTKPLIELTLPTSRDETLAPKGCHVALLFTQYVPEKTEGMTSDADKEVYTQRILDTVEDYAPGFKSCIVGYEALMPSDLEDIFGLTGGNIFHGAMSLDQLYMARPTPFQVGPSTPIKGLYLCGSGAHPGGGVMGAPGFVAARAVIQG
ncbi:UNVERIFIED_CONTAM: hypothetical protein GTU68_012207 [Idotea baltica]|nr:hypothetical protein [Idotea baltica]